MFYVCMFSFFGFNPQKLVKICKKEESLFGGLLAMEPTNIFLFIFELLLFLFV